MSVETEASLPNPRGLIEEGTSRVLIFLGPSKGETVWRELDGVWVRKARSADDIIIPDELDVCRFASRMEASDLAQEALAALCDNPSRASDASNADL
jgi:hypothetical protein